MCFSKKSILSCFGKLFKIGRIKLPSPAKKSTQIYSCKFSFISGKMYFKKISLEVICSPKVLLSRFYLIKLLLLLINANKLV